MADRQQELEKVLEMFKARFAKPAKTVEDRRAGLEDMMTAFPLDEDIVCERVGAGGVPAEWITGPGADEDRIVVYLHGGGYVFGSVRSHRVLMSRISRASGARVLGLDYRLSPENPFPAPLQDTLAAYRWLLSNGADHNRIVIGGDSAGGGLTVSALVAMRYLGEPMPAAGVCISPWTELEPKAESYDTNAAVDPSVSRELVQDLMKMFIGDKDPRAPMASPLFADLHGLPPLLVQVGSIEVILDDSTRLAQRGEAAGVDVELEVWDDMPHVWHQFASILSDGQKAIERVGDFVRKHTD